MDIHLTENSNPPSAQEQLPMQKQITFVFSVTSLERNLLFTGHRLHGELQRVKYILRMSLDSCLFRFMSMKSRDTISCWYALLNEGSNYLYKNSKHHLSSTPRTTGQVSKQKKKVHLSSGMRRSRGKHSFSTFVSFMALISCTHQKDFAVVCFTVFVVW